MAPKYHDGQFAQWVQRMISAGWRWWAWAEPGVMWRHADEYKAALTIEEGERYFRLFCDTGYVPDPYVVMPKAEVSHDQPL